MNKIIVGLSLCVASSVALAASAQVCTGTAGSGAQVTETLGLITGTAGFVKTPFTPKCSANTLVYFAQSANSAAVGSVSTKGNQIFGGNSSGGAVAKTGDCASACATGDASGAADAQLTASSS